MATAVAPLAGSPDRELGALALDFRSVLPLDTTADIPATIAGLQAGLTPLIETEPHAIVRDGSVPLGFRFDGPATDKLAEALRPIGGKINPTMSPEQVGLWLSAMVASLSDLPARVAIKATRDALHVPIRFFPEVEGVIREKAKPHAARYQVAIMRLQRLVREIAEAAKPKLPPPPEPSPPGPEEWAAMARTEIGRTLLSMGKTCGWISEEDYGAAMSSRGVEEAGDGKD